MHPDDPLRPLGHLGDFGDRYRRGVGREDRAFRRQAVQVLEDVEFDLGIFRRGFDDDLEVVKVIEVGGGSDASERVCRLLMADGAFLLQAFEILLDRRNSAAEGILRDVDQRDVPPVLRKHVRDAVPHRSGTHDRDPAHPASQVRGCFQRAPITASVPANSTIVVTMPASGPNGPPSTQGWWPGVYSTAGTWNS